MPGAPNDGEPDAQTPEFFDKPLPIILSGAREDALLSYAAEMEAGLNSDRPAAAETRDSIARPAARHEGALPGMDGA